MYILYLESDIESKFIRKQIHPNTQKTREQRIFIVKQLLSTESQNQ